MKLMIIILIALLIILILGIRKGALEKVDTNKRNDRNQELIKNLERHVKALSNDIGERNFIQYRNLERAADYIKKEFEKYGYSPEEQIYHFEGSPFKNLIATKKGRLYSDKIIIVCAHYDSVAGSPGADDNASGVAGILELSRLLSKEDINKTVRFVATVNEEPPFFTTQDMGSLVYAREAKKRGDSILGVLCLESIGYYSDKRKSQSYPFGLSLFYPDKGNFIGIVSNLSSRRLLKKVVKEFRRQSGFPVEYLVGFSFLAPAISFSDHWSFWEFGYKAVMITDTAFYRNPYYHTAFDTSEKLDYQSMSLVVRGLYRALSELGK